MSDIDDRLLALIQRRLPLVREPFAQLAAELGCSERQVLASVQSLRGAGIIREISAIFDAVALGYRQALLAMRVEQAGLDHAGRVAAGHPGVSHCYARTGDYSLWLTLAVSPASRLGLERSAEVVARLAGAEAHLLLPGVRRYKLQVRFGRQAGPEESSQDPVSAVRPGGPHAQARPTEAQFRAIRALQADLPATADPFASIAASAGMEVDELLVHAADFIALGWMRRYAAVLHHRAAGAEENVLVAWALPHAGADAAGAKCARCPAVSHCYLRPAGKDWPYELYTMIHGRNRQDCELTIQELAAVAGLGRRAELWTLKEYKKQRIGLFGEEEARWEAQHAG